MASIAFPAYLWGRNPGERIIGISHSSDLQIGFSNDFRRIVESAEYQALFPRVKLAKNTETEVHTSQGGYRYARSAEGSLTGFGGGVLILDDFQRPMDMLSEARRTSTSNLYYSTVASRIDNQNTGAILAIGQRLHPDDHIGRLLRSEERWIELTFSAIAEREEYIPIWPGRRHHRRVGDLLHPEQQNREFLEVLRTQELEIFAAQYQQSPIPPGGFLIRRDQIQHCDELPKRTPSSVYIQSWDTGQKPGETNSRSACLDVLVQDNKYFIAHVLVGQWEYHDFEKRVLSHADAHKPNVILIKDAGFGTALIGALKRKRLPVIEVKPEGDKKSRLLREMSKFANSQVFLFRSAPGRAELETELFTFPGGRRNDLVDALSQALSYKYVQPNLWTPEALENYNKLLFGLAWSGFGRR
jgi:predicted phage terminase large subunit-like protein